MGVSNGSNNYRNQHASKISQDKNLWTNYLDYNWYIDLALERLRQYGVRA